MIVGNGGGSTTSAEVDVTVILPARITVQPVSVSVTPGQPATFIVTASGTQPLTYQWRLNFENILNATNSTFTIPAALALTSTPVGERIGFGTTPGKLTLTWPAGYMLQTSTSIQAGTWNSVAGGSPQTITTTSDRAFYRLSKP